MCAKRNPNLGSSQRLAKRRRLFLIRSAIILFFVLIVIFGLAILSGHNKIIIKNFVVSGNGAVTTNEILNIVNRDVSGRYLGLFARNNFIIFPRYRIQTDILTEIKTIKTAKVSWQGWQTVAISVTERKPYAVWCGENILVVEPKCNFVDESGYVFAEAPVFSGNLFVKFYGPIANYSKIFSLIDLLNKRGLEVNSVSFDNLDFTFVLTTGPQIIFNDRLVGFDSSFQNLFTALDSKNLDLINSAEEIKYLDLRFADKIVIGKNENKK
jgi:cell division septal protein FtsQ